MGSGVLQSTFEPYMSGYEAWIKFVNERGGIHGRKIEVSWRDANGQGGAVARDFVEGKKVFAMTDGAFLVDEASQYLEEQGVPVVGGLMAGSRDWFRRTNFFGPGLQDKQMPVIANWAISKGRAKKFALLYYNLGATITACELAKREIVKLGGEVAYEASIPVAAADMTPYVVQARTRGAEGFMTCLAQAHGIALLQALERQGWRAYVAGSTGFADNAMLDGIDPAITEGVEAVSGHPHPSAPLPSMKLYNDLTRKYFGSRMHHNMFSLRGFVSAMLFTTALEQSGPKAVRSGVMGWFNSKDQFEFDGLLPPDTSWVPGKGRPNEVRPESYCGKIWRAQQGKFVDVTDGRWLCASRDS